MSDNNRIEGKGHRRYQGRDTENNFFSKKWGMGLLWEISRRVYGK